MDFKKGSVIMTGDLNFCLEPGIDSTSRAQGTRNTVENNKKGIVSVSIAGYMESAGLYVLLPCARNVLKDRLHNGRMQVTGIGD